ncbi:hypothetical protein E2C01_041224 [Portunus trituberculatus]|uniref:Endonuclease/exonuclease/phosphatase domain-containing protein n=1 Tax=Portunus trituberculatus TaxID=210409 RepID=A0A5B7FPU5_PORTR|nr:hypothetical protein [Portunus trituberculatus]
MCLVTPPSGHGCYKLNIVSANIHGFHTNVGELMHRFTLKNDANLVFVRETFLDDRVPATYARVKGYLTWIRKDCSTHDGGLAFCLSVAVLDMPIPMELEMILLKLVWGTALLQFLTDNMDCLLTTHQCENMIILGDLNPHGVQHAFDSLLEVFDLTNPVTFLTHRSSSTLDPVITDLTAHEVHCSSLGPVGSSDHIGILTRIFFKRPRDDISTRTLWQWDKAN